MKIKHLRRIQFPPWWRTHGAYAVLEVVRRSDGETAGAAIPLLLLADLEQDPVALMEAAEVEALEALR